MVFAIMIGGHYWMTTSRMDAVKKIFNDGGTVICENKMHRTISGSILISKKFEWELKGDEFVSKNYVRSFHTSRCVDYAPVSPDSKLRIGKP